MPRIRTIKPEFWLDRKLAKRLTRDQRMFYIGLWNQADDEGRFIASSRHLLGSIFPHDDDLDESFIEDSLRAHGALTTVVLYEVDGERYGQIVKWREHQRVNRPTPSRIPPPPNDLGGLTESSLSPHGVLTEPSLPEQGTGNREQEVEVPSELFSLMRSGETVYAVERAYALVVDAGLDPTAVIAARRAAVAGAEKRYWPSLARWLAEVAKGGLPKRDTSARDALRAQREHFYRREAEIQAEIAKMDAQ